jgi:hypothetical protein
MDGLAFNWRVLNSEQGVNENWEARLNGFQKRNLAETLSNSINPNFKPKGNQF